MTKKDYELIAKVIDNCYGAQAQAEDMRREIAHHLAVSFGIENPQFDYKRFMSACDCTPERES